ncbi:MAG: DUF2798 domain-containing protein [Pseudomonadota bacterium]
MPDLRPFVFPVVMAAMMSFVMSAIITALNLGLTPDFAAQWMGAWSVSGPLAVTGVLLLRPVGQWIADGITTRLFPRRADA